MYLSKVIHNDVTVANVTSWSFWTAMDIPHYGHKNRFLLISLTPAAGEWGDIREEGTYAVTHSLWVLGNYSRFIRPGYQRLSMTYDESRDFFGLSWISPDGSEIVTVMSNLSDKGIRLNESHQGWMAKPSQVTLYTTTAAKQLVPTTLEADQQILLEPQSVTTIVYKLNHL